MSIFIICIIVVVGRHCGLRWEEMTKRKMRKEGRERIIIIIIRAKVSRSEPVEIRSRIKRKPSQGRGTARTVNQNDERGIFTSQSNGKIRVGGEEAMEPSLESLGERG